VPIGQQAFKRPADERARLMAEGFGQFAINHRDIALVVDDHESVG
jgi:hypothetical protein